MTPIRTESSWRGTSDCLKCGMRKFGIFADLTVDDLTAIRAPIDIMVYEPGDVMYTEGSPAQGIYCVSLGVVKLLRSTVDGRQRIVRVLRAGDVIGLEALAAHQYDSEAVAQNAVSVCRISFEVIESILQNSNRLQAQLMNKWRETLKDAEDWLVDLNFGTARHRVSQLILKMRCPTDATISMLFSREDMGLMLDLKVETVSRVMSRLKNEGAIEAMDRQGRIFRILKLDVLTTS